ncbi:Dinoflagellate viral nucleoprotein 5 (DNVP5) [Durusdinium trenchii]|uniref:Dinoflagellate viral nucleoprotein 5 (DNVP5) n=1 Tax=Durusdinium trenchii TaxID=1381693 RepID=A0ABP0SAP2_9DINO
MALPMKKSVMKSSAMKSMKKAAMKAAMKVMKKKAVSKIARGKRAKASVFKGNKEKTASGHAKTDLMKNKRGKVVSKLQNAAGKKAYKNISAWNTALMQARKELGIKGFCAVNGKTAQGKALYAKAKAIFAA